MLKAKRYELDELETGMVAVGEDLRILLERLADDKLVARKVVKTDQTSPY